jgi:fatty acid desaturase
MRPLRSLGRAAGGGDALAAVALLAAVVVIFPPSHLGGALWVPIPATVVLIVVAVHVLRRVFGPSQARHIGRWARASAALAASCSVLMIAGAAAVVLT